MDLEERLESISKTSARLSRTQRRKREAEELKKALLLAFVFGLIVFVAELLRPVILFGLLISVYISYSNEEGEKEIRISRIFRTVLSIPFLSSFAPNDVRFLFCPRPPLPIVIIFALMSLRRHLC